MTQETTGAMAPAIKDSVGSGGSATVVPAQAIGRTDNLAAVGKEPPQVYDVRVMPFGNSAWIACEVIHLLCVIVALYLLYALLHFRAIRFTHPNATARHRKGGFWLENLCIAGIVLALIRFANNQALLFTGFISGPRCSILLNVSIAFYFMAIHPVYMFLWVRQRIFYSNRALKHLYSKTVRFLSWAALVSFIIITIVMMVLFVVDAQNSASGRVCNYTPISENLHTYAPKNLSGTSVVPRYQHQGVKVNTIAGLLGGGIQTSFLALFLYPIMDNKLRAVRTNQRSGTVGLMTLIRRSFILAGMCILSDVAIALLVKTITTQFPSAPFAPLAMYDLNLIINLICIIMTFRRWRVMLSPWLYTNTCRTLFEWLGNCSRRGHPGTSGSYMVAGKERALPLKRIFSVDTLTRMDQSGASSARHAQQNPRPSYTQRQESVDIEKPRPVVVPLLTNGPDINQNHNNHEALGTESLLASLHQSIDSESQPYSDSVLQLAKPDKQRMRSSSLVVTSSTVPSLKHANAKVAVSLLSKSRLYIFNGKHTFNT